MEKKKIVIRQIIDDLESSDFFFLSGISFTNIHD